MAEEKLNKLATILGGLLIFALVIIVIVLAALYGDKYNCEKPKPTPPPKPSMVHYKQIVSNHDHMKKLTDGNSNAHMETIAYSQVPGKEMQGGIFHLEAGPALEYTHWYEGILVILSGEFNITDGTGQTMRVTAKDSLYIPRGTKVTYRTPNEGLLYNVIHPSAAPDCAAVQAAVAENRSIVRMPNFDSVKDDLPYYNNTDYNKLNSLSYLNDTIYSNVTGQEMVGGLYKLLKGPALDYTYEYEEFKYIVSGEFVLTDGTGKKVSAKAGDLLYFPKGTFVHFTSPDKALGFFVGQRALGTA